MNLLLFNKPFGVLSQFGAPAGASDAAQSTLADWLDAPGFYPAGRLDYHSEGLLLLTNQGALQHRISHPHQKLAKHYWVMVEGDPGPAALEALRGGIVLKDGHTRPAQARAIPEPRLWAPARTLPEHRLANSSWLEIVLREGRNRQVRRMLAAVGHPVLRLVRHRVGPWQLADLQPGDSRYEQVHLPKQR